MRRLTLLMTAILFLCVNGYAQNDSKVKGLKDNLAKSDAAIQDPKKEIDPKTWMNRGKLFQDIYGLNVSYLRFGMPVTEIKLYYKDPKQILSIEENGAMRETYEYSQINVTFENGALKYWEETQSIIDDPIGKAVESYKKASSLDDKGKNTKKINEAYNAINNDLENKAFNEYYSQKYKEAYKSALQRIEVSKLLGITDTIYYYYAGFFAYAQSESNRDMWKESLDNLQKAASIGFKETGENKGHIYVMLYNSSINLGDSAKALKYAQEGFEKNPENIELIYVLINHYLQRNESREALVYVEKAKANDPKNATLLFAEGTLYDKIGEKDKAISAYDAAIASDPKFFNPYFNKAVVYYNSAVKMMEEADKQKEIKKYEEMKEVAEKEFVKAIPPLEQAHAINPKDRDVMETLKSLYYRLKAKNPEMESKYVDIVKKLEEL